MMGINDANMQACKKSQVATPNACYPVNRLYGRSKLMAYKHILVAVDLSPESSIYGAPL